MNGAEISAPPLFSWLFRRAGTYTVMALGLLLVAMISLGSGLGATVRRVDLFLLFNFSALGLLAGWLLGRFRGLPAGLAIGTLGFGAVLLSVGNLTGITLAALGSLLGFSLQLMRPPYGQPDPAPVIAVLGEFVAQFDTVLSRLSDWLSAIAARQPAFDLVAVNLAWGFIFWLVASWAAWWVRRHDRPLVGLAPALVVMAAAAGITGESVFFLIPMLVALLLLLPLASHHGREARWEGTGIDYALDVRADLGLSAAVLATVLATAAFFVPSISIERIADFVRDLIRESETQAESIPESLGLEPGPGEPSAFAVLRAPGLPRTHLIGSGPELSQQIVMAVSPEQIDRRYYWRSATYDQYTGRGWVTSSVSESNYRAGVEIANVPLPGQVPVEVDVQLTEGHEGVVYTPGRLISVDTDFTVGWRSDGDMFSGATTSGSYTVDAFLAAPSESQLLASPAGYPEAITERYLSLPDSVPARVLSLARELTATLATPYERAQAIESYLRAFPYTLDLPAPPPNRDIADYFVFELQKGYCDYYATSMVVLARAAGLPSRIVIGYALGAYDEDTGRYIVAEANAHSWVEVYFADLGWVEFEPTGGLPAIERPQTTAPTPTMNVTPPPQNERDGWMFGPTGWPRLVGALVVLAAGAIAAWGAGDWIGLVRLTPAQTLSVLYRRLASYGRRFTVPMTAGDTPYEFGQSLADRLASLARRRRWLQPSISESRALVDLYVRACYSPRPPTRVEQSQAIRLWQRLRWRLWGARLLR